MGPTPGRRAAAAVSAATLAAAVLAAATPTPAGASATGASQPACATAARAGAAVCATAVSAAPPSSSSQRASSHGSAASSAASSGTPAGYSPVQLQSAYDLPSQSAGNLQTVAVVTPFDDPDAASDLATYRSQFGELPCPQTQSLSTPACFTEINESGALILPGSGTSPAGSPSWGLTASSQLDAVSAVCPTCRVLLVEVNSASIPDLGAGVEQAVSNGARMVTIGAYEPEVNEDPTWDSAYFRQPGVAITAAAGDHGYQPESQNFPAASQYVTAVGGTTLTAAGAGSCTTTLAGARGWCESVWNDSYGATASGCSLYDPEPAWQTSDLPAADTGCGSMRTVADVSADADPATGIAVYDSDGEGGWQGGSGVGGTAVAAAIIAGVYALAGTPQANDDPAMYPYEHQAGLNPITTGTNTTASNPSCSPAYLCTAGTGYDGPSGLGSPAGTTAFTAAGGLTGPIYNGVDNMCADNHNDTAANGNKVQIWACLGDASQNWTIEAGGTIRTNGYCLDNTGGSSTNGNKIQLYQCLGDANQQWQVQPQGNGTLAPGVELVNPATGKCLDNYDTSATDGGTDNGTQLDLWACNGDPNQMWSLPYPQIGAPDRIISNYPSGAGAASPLCAEDYDASTSNANKIDIWTCDDNAGAQDWLIAANGTLTIGGSCMDVRGLGTTSKTVIQLWSCTGATNQQWRFLSDGAIMGLESGLCLDETSTTTNGTQLFIYNCNQDAAQTWTAVPYSADF